MKLIAIPLVFFAVNLIGQTVYKGEIDSNPIELVANIYSDGVVKAFYVYTKFDDPIKLDGTLKDSTLILNEKDRKGQNTANFTFKSFRRESSNIEGVWKNLKSGKEFKTKLTKSFEIDIHAQPQTDDLLQSASMPTKYFEVEVHNNDKGSNANVTAVKIYEKKTDKLLQQINLECKILGYQNVQVDDYNFDGVMDFSVFEQSYAGPNTSRLYFLYDPKTDKYFRSSFKGTSLQFDQKAKRIFEHNQCCAGKSHMNAEYKVVDNQMILVKKTCMEYDDKLQDYKEIKCEE